jgi:lysophospholipase L1-like esterase
MWMPASDRRLTIQGLAWFKENGGCFSRLPLRAKGRVRQAVWDLAQSPAGARIAFRTDSTRLSVRVSNSDTGVMYHMPGTGSNGLALYCGEPYRMRAWVSAVPDPALATFERDLFKDLPPAMREFRLYLPLYKQLKSLDLAFSPGARILPPSPFALPKPVVFYGTSITQGGCAATAGSDFVSAVGRMLNLDVVNLGFSGNGWGEPELAELAAEIDASLFVLDYAGNADEARMKRTLSPFVRILRARHPATPILIVGPLGYTLYGYHAPTRQSQEAKRDIMMGVYLQWRKKGDANIHFADGLSLLPFDLDGGHVDGVHPTTHGFLVMAERLAPYVARILLPYG